MLTSLDTNSIDPNRSLDDYRLMVNMISGINYIIDTNYKITTYSEIRWNEFARANDGNDLINSDLVVGQSILEFIEGQKVKNYYKNIYDLILEGKRDEIRIKSKCDGPEVLRDNVIFLTPIHQNLNIKDEIIGILHQSLILKKEDRPEVKLIDRKNLQHYEGGNFVKICSICKFVHFHKDGQYEWIPTKRYYQLGGTDSTKLEHSICEDCSRMLDEFL